MYVIGKVFKKNFLRKYNIYFQKNIYEDILFSFKCHYYNNEKINFFKEKIYKKKYHPLSITNSNLTLSHIKSKYRAFKNIELLIKKKNMNTFKKYYQEIQFRWRGEFYNEYIKIMNLKFNKLEKELFVNYTKKIYKNSISKNFKVITRKDKFTKEKLFNV